MPIIGPKASPNLPNHAAEWLASVRRNDSHTSMIRMPERFISDSPYNAEPIVCITDIIIKIVEVSNKDRNSG